MIKELHPHKKFNLEKAEFEGGLSKSSLPQQLIYRILSPYFDDLQLNYRHQKLLHSRKNIAMELDFWSEKNLLAIEYQGEQHFSSVSNTDQLK